MAIPRIPDKYDWAQDTRPVSTFTMGVGGFFRSIGAALICGVLALVLALVGFFAPVKEGPVVAMTMGILCSAGLVGCVIWGVFSCLAPIKHVRVYEDGVLWISKGKWYGALWEDIDECYRKEIIVNGTANTRDLAIKTRRGQKAVFSIVLSRWEKLAEAVQMRVTMLRGPEVQEDYQAGESVRFGPVTVGQDGLKVDGKELEWDEIKSIEIVNGYLSVQAGGKRGKSHDVALGDIPNYLVMLRLLEDTPAPPVQTSKRGRR